MIHEFMNPDYVIPEGRTKFNQTPVKKKEQNSNENNTPSKTPKRQCVINREKYDYEAKMVK